MKTRRSRKKRKFINFRIQKDCLNCKSPIVGDYCHQCGQPNYEVKHNFFALIWHYVADVFHYDNKLWRTLKFLFFRPGHLSKHFNAGARKQFIHPIKMYIFISAVTFILLSLTPKLGEMFKSDERKKDDQLKQLYEQNVKDYFGIEKLQKQYPALESNVALNNSKQQLFLAYKGFRDSMVKRGQFSFISDSFKVQEQGFATDGSGLVSVGKDARITKEIEKNHFGDFSKFTEVLVQKVVKLMPKLIFFLVPIYAFLLFLSCSRRKKNFYADHFVFALHTFSLIFLLYLIWSVLTNLLGNLEYRNMDGFIRITHWILGVGLIGYFLFNNYKALQVHASSGRAKWHIVRFLGTNFFMFVLFWILLMVAFIYYII